MQIPLDTRSTAAPEVPAPAAPRSRLRVLIIEDNRDAAESLQGVLSQCDCDVHISYDGSQGIESARALLPNVVFCDIGLQMSGYDMARALRAEGERDGERAVLVALTGYALPEDRERARAAGFEHHLAKPAGPDRLKQVLASVPPRARAISALAPLVQSTPC